MLILLLLLKLTLWKAFATSFVIEADVSHFSEWFNTPTIIMSVSKAISSNETL